MYDKKIDKRLVAGPSANGNTIADFANNGTIKIKNISKPTT
jgi:hypothetical protein